jgi:hypothetical protein
MIEPGAIFVLLEQLMEVRALTCARVCVAHVSFRDALGKTRALRCIARC